MRYSIITFIAGASAHAVLTTIQGANNVTMPGLSVADGTPRDCTSNGCGSQADTSIIKDREIGNGEVGPLGRTQGNGPVKAETMIAAFMGAGTAPTNAGAADSVGVEDDLEGLEQQRQRRRELRARQLSNLFGGGNDANDAEGTQNEFAAESIVGDMAGTGATSGLPTCSDDGQVTVVMRQINGDGAGPNSADVDGTSGGTEESAFQAADITTDVPGRIGLTRASNTDFPVTVQMPAGMTCDATVADVDNVCVMRVRNPIGPFGGSAAFTQSATARKRAIAYRLKKRMEISRSQ